MWPRTLLAMVVGCQLFAAPTLADDIKISGTGAAYGVLPLLQEAFAKAQASAKAPSTKLTPVLGSAGSIKAVGSNMLDVSISARSVNDEEKALGLRSVEWCRTPFVLATPDQTPVSDLSLQQVADIYSGKTKTWPDNSKIRLVVRPASDSDTTLLQSFNPAVAQAVTRSLGYEGVKMGVNDLDTVEALESIKGSLGQTALVLISKGKHKLKPLKINGVEPSIENLKSGAYAHQKTFYITTRTNNSVEARQFAQFLVSPRSQKILNAHGCLFTYQP